MLRIMIGLVVVGLIGGAAGHPVAEAQAPGAEATIAALQTRVADLESQLGLNPTPTVRAAPSAVDVSDTGVVGTALALIPAGVAGELSIVATGAFDEGTVPIVLRNNTDAAITSIEVSGDVRDRDGRVTQTVSGNQFKPVILQPGQVAIGSVYLGQPVAPTDVVHLEADGTADLSYYEARGAVSLETVEFNDLGDRITGSVQNPSGRATTDTGYLQLMCLDDAGTPLWTNSGSVDAGMAPGDIAAFEFGKFGGIPVDCGNYLFGAYSYTG